MGKGNPRKVSKEEKTAEKTMHSASPESKEDSDGSRKLLSDPRDGRTSTEDIIQSFDAPVSHRKKPNVDESISVRENKRKTSVYSLVNFDSKGSANRRSNFKQDNTAENSTQKDPDVILEMSRGEQNHQR